MKDQQHSRTFSKFQSNQDQQSTLTIVEPHKSSRMFCIKIDYNSKKTGQLKSNKYLPYITFKQFVTCHELVPNHISKLYFIP